jgi:ribonuclease HI
LEENVLESRQTHQFEKLFNGVEVSKEDIKWAEEIRNQYNKLNGYAFRLKDEYGEAPGPRLTLKTKEGEELEIIHTLDATHPQVYSLENAKIYFRKNEGTSHPELKYVAFAEVPGEKNKQGKPLFKRIGYVSKVSEKNNNLIEFEPNKTISKTISGSVTVNPGVTPNQIKAAFSQVREFVEKTYSEIPDEEKQRKAAALWEVTHRRQTKIRNEQGQLDDKQRFNKAVAAFAIFGDEIQQRLNTLQFNQVKVAGVNSAYSQTGILPQNSIVPIVIKVEDNERSSQFGRRTVYLRGKQENGEIVHARLGYLPEDEAQLPINCFATATVSGDIERVAEVTLENGQKIKVEQLKNYDYATTLFDTSAELEITTAVPNGRKNPVPAVKLNGKLLGIIKREHRHILEQQKLTQGQKIKVQLNRGYYDNTMSLNIDSESISYLPQHTKEKHILQRKEPMKQDIKPFWSIDNNQAKIVVKQGSQEKFKKFFDEKNINYKIIKNHQKAGREANLGLVVFEVDESEINKLDRAELEKVWRKPLSALEYENKLTEIEGMPKQLPSESEENNATKSDSTTQTSSTSSDSPPWITESEVESNNSSSHSEKENKETVQLTAQQQEAFDKMRTWLSSPRNSLENNLFCLEGYAGTGKSFTVTHFVEAAKKDFPWLTIGYTGPTHEAVNVGRQLSKKLNIKFDDARTLHSLLKYRPGIDNKKNEERFLGGKLDSAQISELPDLIIVDEVSMVNEEMYDLLKELAQHSKKILLVGDNAQIRPVNEGRSKAFSDPTIKHRSELTEVVRYSNQLGYLATALRTNQQERKPLITSCPDQTVVGQNQQDWTNNILTLFTSEEFNKDPNYFQVYAYTNARVDELNNQIRKARFGDDAPEYVPGEIIVANDNGRDLDEMRTIYNGEELKVINAKLAPDLDENKFSTWLLTVESVNDSSPPFDIKIIAKESQQAFNKKVKELDKAWKNEKNPGLKREKYKKAQGFNQSYNNISYNYARTYHKAQGKTKTKVAIDQQNINDSFNKRIEQTKIEASRQDLIQQMQELTYVAATRASEQLFVYNNKASLNLSQQPWYLPNEEWEKYQTDINNNQEPLNSSLNNSDQFPEPEPDTNTNSPSFTEVPPIPDEDFEPTDDEEDIPSIEDLEDNYNTDFDPEQVPEPLDEYEDQDNNNSQPSDKNNIKPKPKLKLKTNNNTSSNNDKKTHTQTPSISIPGKPVNMNYKLELHGEENKLPVSTTINAMRGYGRVHTTRPFEPHKAYGFKEGDLAIAYSGNKENPDKQVLFLVGEQHKITDEMIDDPKFREEWSDKEKHSPQELYSLQKRYHKNNEEKLWGLNMTPLGDYRDGKVYSFETGEDITEDVLNKNYQKILEQQEKFLESQTQTSQTPEEDNLDNTSKPNQNNSNSEAKTPTSSQKLKPITKPKVEEKINEVSEPNPSKDHNKPKITERNSETETSQPTQLTVYCKGISEQKNGGWGYSIYEGDKALKENYGGQNNTSEIDMEFRAVLNSISKAIELNPKAQIIIVTSQSFIDELKKDSSKNKDLWDKINEIADGRQVNINNESTNESTDSYSQKMAKVYNLAKKGLDSVHNKETNLTEKNLNESNNQSEINTTQKTNVILDLEDNINPPFIPLNEIPSNPEFDLKSIMKQQERTEKVAPIAYEIVQLQNNNDSPTSSYRGDDYDINYDGYYLTITNKQGDIKMKARYMGTDPITQEQKWLNCLPANSPGLTSDDVQRLTSQSLRESIIMAKIEQHRPNMVVA